MSRSSSSSSRICWYWATSRTTAEEWPRCVRTRGLWVWRTWASLPAASARNSESGRISSLRLSRGMGYLLRYHQLYHQRDDLQAGPARLGQDLDVPLRSVHADPLPIHPTGGLLDRYEGRFSRRRRW